MRFPDPFFRPYMGGSPDFRRPRDGKGIELTANDGKNAILIAVGIAT